MIRAWAGLVGFYGARVVGRWLARDNGATQVSVAVS